MILSFKPRFVPSVQDGTKPHTIRKGQRWRVGMGIQFYQGPYHRKRDKFRPDAVATVVQAVRVEQPERYLGPPPAPRITIDDRLLTLIECATLANTDGFDTVAELVAFLNQAHGLPFTGQLIGWTDIRY